MPVTAKSEKIPNKMQQLCIENTSGKYLVLAGPGTGKTFTIIERIKNMLSMGISPEKILCLTFTDAAATEMKKRIDSELNVVSSGVQVYTYHGFCCEIIDENPDEFEIPANYKIISDSISKAFIKECIDELNPKYFRTDKNDPYFYINTIKRRISSIKQNRLTKEKYFKNIEENPDWMPEKKRLEQKIEAKHQKGDSRTIGDEADLASVEKKINQAVELWSFYELYSKKMEEQRYLDFNDMINLVLNKFETNPSFLSKIANRFEYIMVDEYQDTNKPQNDIVMALSHAIETGNVFVVGDDDQIIYRFQGAKLDTIENYLKEFPDTKIICLKENMRSTQSILDTARAVISQDPLSLVNTHSFTDIDGNPINKNLTAKNIEVTEKDKPVRFYKYADLLQEYTEIVNEIEALINSDNCPLDKNNGEKAYSQIAILTRTNSEAEQFGEMLKMKNIPYELKDGKDIFKIPAVNILYFYIQFLINPKIFSHRIFELLVSPPFNIDINDYDVLYREVSKGETFIDVLRNISPESFKNPEQFRNFLNTYDYLQNYKSKENIKNTILEIGAKTGIFDYYLNTEINRSESIAGIKRFLDEAEGFSEIYRTGFLEEFYTYLKSIIEDEETINTDKAPVNMNAVQLCTYHGSKGREFEYVYMPTLDTYKWERGKITKPEIPVDKSEYKSEDELKNEVKPSDLTKLMYVAMTRAKHTLRMSYSEKVNGKERKPTKFIVNIQDLLEKESKPFEYNEQTYWSQVRNLLVKKDYDYKKDFSELIKSGLADRAFSVSSVNRYLACPRQYLYGDILNLTPKDGNPNSKSYGTAVHSACEKAVSFIRDNNGEIPDKTQFINWFKQELGNLPMESYEQRINFTVRGENALGEYYSQIVNIAPGCLYEVEYKLQYTLDDGTKFVGYIDRLDRNSDGTYTIYDYKTGNNKNSGIKIGGEHEDYYNQMALYKYFYELISGNKVSLTKFLYPEDFSSKNNGITFTEDEVNSVFETFKKAVADIKACEFEPSYNEKACKYCQYRDFCGMNRI